MRRDERMTIGRLTGRQGCERGFGFVEALIAMTLLSFAVISTAQMIVTGIYVSEASEDRTSVTSLASDIMETLKSADFDDLTAGGDLETSVSGYSDVVDPDGDGVADFTRRWEIVDLGLSKTIDVMVLGPDTAMGDARRIRLTALLVDKQ
jgi:Tfp pilus assembly protein PilV